MADPARGQEPHYILQVIVDSNTNRSWIPWWFGLLVFDSFSVWVLIGPVFGASLGQRRKWRVSPHV